MNRDTFVLLTLTLFLGIYLFFLLYTPPSNYKLQIPLDSTTVPFDQLKAMFSENIAYVEKNSSVLDPYDEDKMKQVKIGFQNMTDLSSLPALLYLLPNSGLGFYGLDPLLGSPIDTTCFQFEQGRFGWHWLYGTWPTPTPSSFMFYLMREDVACPSIRKKHKLQPGEATVYTIAIGVGQNGVWHFSPYIAVRARYQVFTKASFAFTALDFPNGGKCNFTSPSLGTFVLDCAWTSTDGQPCSVNVVMMSNQMPYYNAKVGCSPCIGGAGTLYWSYTQMNTGGTLTIGQTQIPVQDGDGWIDHQWANSTPNQALTAILSNITRLSSKTRVGLGRYIWLNLHVKNEGGIPRQYMVSSLLSNSVKDGDKISGKANKYGPTFDPKYDEDADITVLGTVSLSNPTSYGGDIVYPTKYNVKVSGNNYILDSTPFGNTVTIDLTGNFHWSGSALLLDTKNNVIGTGFLEANQFQTDNQYYSTLLAQAKIPQTQLKTFTNQTLNFMKTLPGLFVLLFGLFLLIFVIVSWVKGLNMKFENGKDVVSS